MMAWISPLLALICLLGFSIGHAKPPNILFIVADDLGYNDLGYMNNGIISPNIDNLAKQGTKFTHAYVQPVCSPSRTSWLSGYMPYHTGLQHGIIFPRQPVGLPLNLTTLPQRLKEKGYKTHMVGKWHSGFCNWDYTPTYRGFDSFVGFYNAGEDHYEHNMHFPNASEGYDFRYNKNVYEEAAGVYSNDIFRDRAVEVVTQHNRSTPLFLYVAFQNPHWPLQVPDKYIQMYPNVKNKDRKIYSAMVTAMDEAVGTITRTLRDRNMLEETVIFFTSDNGADPTYGGNNWPLRGGKSTVWEGGTRALAFAYGLGVQSGANYDGLFHAVDWYPTILSAAGGDIPPGLDGVDQWESIKSNSGQHPRMDMVYNIDSLADSGAYRQGDYKLIVGDPAPFSPFNDWYPVPQSDASPGTSRVDHVRQVLRHENSILGDRRPVLRLFNLEEDPEERVDLSSDRPDLVELLYIKYILYKETEVPAKDPPDAEKGDPKYYDGTWSPGWC